MQVWGAKHTVGWSDKYCSQFEKQPIFQKKYTSK